MLWYTFNSDLLSEPWNGLHPSQAVKTIPTNHAKNEPLVVSERTKTIVRLRKCTVQDISMLTVILSDCLVKLRTKDDKSLFRKKFRFVRHGFNVNSLKSCRNNKKRENREYYFITCIFPNIKLKSGFRISWIVRRTFFEESTTTTLTPYLLGVSTFLGFLKSGGNSNGVTAMWRPIFLY